MTPHKRIALNTIATYGRTMFGVVCGVFSTRWVLAALGQEDYGLYAVVGGMVVFLNFLNIQLAGSISRYYAFSIGQMKRVGTQINDKREVSAWFTTAVIIHSVIPVLLIAVGLPLGSYVMETSRVAIPPHRLEACLCVWRIVCISSFCGMVCVPFQAMYTAKQYIAELTIYSFVQTLIKTIFIYYMVVHPRDWLVSYAMGVAVIVTIPQFVIAIRAVVKFEECRIIPSALCEVWRIKQVACYALWTAIGGIGYIASHQCMNILLNNFFGAKVAGGGGVAQTVSGEASSLTGALQGAFQPAIATKFGEGDIDATIQMAFLISKVGTLLTLMFALPIALEINKLLGLWLETPPPYSSSFCLCALAFVVFEKFTCGHLAAVNASGKIAKFQIVRGLLRMMVIPFAFLPICFGGGPVAVMMALPVSVLFVDVGDVVIAKQCLGISVRRWMKELVLPIGFATTFGVALGALPRIWFPESVVRLLITFFVSLGVFAIVSWIVVLSRREKRILLEYSMKLLNKSTSAMV